MVTLNSTIISGANALAAIRPLLTDNAQLLLVTDGNIARLEAATQIRSILEEGNRRVTVIDTVPPEPSHHDVSQLLARLNCGSFDVVVGIGAAAYWMWRNCSPCFVTRCHRGWTACWQG